MFLCRMSVCCSASCTNAPWRCSGVCCSTSPTSWCGRRTRSCQLNSSRGTAPAGALIDLQLLKSLQPNVVSVFLHNAARRTMRTTASCTTTSTTRTTTSSTPCSARWTATKPKRRRTQHLSTKRCVLPSQLWLGSYHDFVIFVNFTICS